MSVDHRGRSDAIGFHAHIDERSVRSALLAVALTITSVAPAVADSLLPAMGGHAKGQSFTARCARDQQVTGFGLRTGDDVNAMWPLCVTAYGPSRIGPIVAVSTPGGRGEHVNHVKCPPEKPVVLGLSVGSEGSAGSSGNVVVNSVEIHCGSVAALQRPSNGYPDARFEAPAFASSSSNRGKESQLCPAGLVAVGIHGHAGNWVEKVGLICAEPVITEALTPPLAPLDLRARMPATLDGAKAQILIEWNTPDQSRQRPVDSYTIERQSPPGPARPWLAEAVLPGPKGSQSGSTRLAFQFKSSALDPRQQHAFRVCAVNGSGTTCAAPVLAATQQKTAMDVRASDARAFKAPDRTPAAAKALGYTQSRPTDTNPGPGIPRVLEPKAGSTHPPQTAMKIRVAAPHGTRVKTYELQFQRLQPDGWKLVTSAEVAATEIEGIGYAGWGAHQPGTAAQMTASAGRWRVRPRAIDPSQPEPGEWIEFTVAGAPGHSAEKQAADRTRVPNAAAASAPNKWSAGTPNTTPAPATSLTPAQRATTPPPTRALDVPSAFKR